VVVVDTTGELGDVVVGSGIDGRDSSN
jgi:hypothetical protein